MRSIPLFASRPSPAAPAPGEATPTLAGLGPRRRRRPSLRLVLALSLGALGLAATLAMAALIAREATARLETEVGAQLGELAEHTARTLDLGMFERWRDVQVAASLDVFGDPAVPLAEKRAVLTRLQQTYPAYSIIALVDPDGRIAATSSGLLEGVNVAHRDYFRAGRERPFVGDVHDAILLAKLLPFGTGEPLRLIDVAAPVHDREGRFAGVLVAHLDWAWAREVARTLARSLRGRREGAEIMVLAADGTVLLGPPALESRALPPDTLTGGRSTDARGSGRIGPWPDGEDVYVSAVEPTSGYRDYAGLGWRVAVRHKAEVALRSVSDLRWGVLASGTLVALVAAMLAWVMAGRIARPLQEIARAAEALGRNEPLPALSHGVVEEGRLVAEALSAAADELRQREAGRRLLVDELNHRVKNTLATVQSIAAQSLKGLGDGAAAGRAAFEGRLLALSCAHNVLTRESWSSADLRDIVHEAVAPFGGEAIPPASDAASARRGEGGGRFAVSGPHVRLAPQTALALTMILHELCTNAVKYGALSATGRVALAWEVIPDGAGALRLTWRETGGPPVRRPERTGFGSRLIERGLASVPEGAVSLRYDPSGLVCTLALALTDAARDAAPDARGGDDREAA